MIEENRGMICISESTVFVDFFSGIMISNNTSIHFREKIISILHTIVNEYTLFERYEASKQEKWQFFSNMVRKLN